MEALFGRFYNIATGNDFRKFLFERGVTPLSTYEEVSFSIFLYLIVIFAVQWIMKSRKCPEIKTLVILHNLFLSVSSLIVLVLILSIIFPLLYQNGLYWSICSEKVYSAGPVELLYYINYLLKYYELLDTVILVLRKKPLEFLHVYHHTLTLILCFTQLRANSTVQWVPISLNLFVHVLMTTIISKLP